MEDTESIKKLYSINRERCNEIEAVFRIDLLSFNRVLKFLLNEDPNIQKKITEDKIVTENFSKFRLTDNKIIKKSRLSFFQSKYDFRVNFNTEEPIEGNLPDGIITTRIKERWSLIKKDYIIDLTIVNSIGYELEVEFLENIDEILRAINTLLLLVQGTKIIYTVRDFKNKVNVPLEKDLVFIEIIKKLGFTNDATFGSIENKLVQLDYGLLTYENFFLKNNYRLSHKSDGKHYFLYINRNGIYLLTSNTEMNKIYGRNNLPNTLVEGELIDNDFVIFDTLISGGESVLENSHDLRIRQWYKDSEDKMEIAGFLNSVGYNLLTKSFYTIDTVDKFYTVVSKLLSTSEKNDGIVFVNSGKYSNTVYKWKPLRMLTIDFLIERRGKQIVLKVGSEKGNIEFEGKVFTPKGGIKTTWNYNSAVNIDHSAFSGVPNGSIAECAFIDNKFTPIRLRDDKLKPNFYKTASNNWNSINDYISEEVLLGLSTKLVQKYHNKIKRELFQDSMGSYLLDIGTGRGGDISKTVKFKRIIAVEPDPVNIKELKNRWSKYEKNLPVVLETGGEDPKVLETVKKNLGKADVVSMMLSLSFFFGDDELLSKLLRNICGSLKIGGEFIFLTINGDETKKLFKNAFSHQVKLNGAEFTMTNENSMHVKIDNTIVRGQIEYFVDLVKLEKFLYFNGFELDYIKQANDEKFFSDSEQKFTNMYSYGKFVKKRDVEFNIPTFVKLQKDYLLFPVELIPNDKVEICKEDFCEVLSGKDSAEIFRKNRHMQQNTENSLKIYNTVQRILKDSDPQLPYRRRKDEKKTVIHWGQRKLLLSEIEFLNEYSSAGDNIIYVGAAPGTHIPFLSSLFPELTFLLFDPAEFSINESSKVKIFREFFTDSVAEKYKGQNVLFISDIRSVSYTISSDQEVEDAVRRDQTMQMNWVKTLEPKSSMLKFRLPWKGKSNNYTDYTDYLDGLIYLPIWGPITTTETRLIVPDYRKNKMYDNSKYEEQMIYFNTITRVQYYKHDVFGVPGLCHCYDCAAEVKVLTDFINKKNLNVSVSDLINNITTKLSKTRDLTTFMDKKDMFESRLYDTESNTIFTEGPDQNSKIQYLKKYPKLFNGVLEFIEQRSPKDIFKLLKSEIDKNKNDKEIYSKLRKIIEPFNQPEEPENILYDIKRIIPYNPDSILEVGTGEYLTGLAEEFKISNLKHTLDFSNIEETFDLILCIDKLYNSENIDFYLKNIYRVLDTNGILIIRDIDLVSTEIGVYNDVINELKHQVFSTATDGDKPEVPKSKYYTVKSLRKLLTDNGFQHVSNNETVIGLNRKYFDIYTKTENTVDKKMLELIPMNTIGEGHCLFHAVLQACCKLYQENKDKRRTIANVFRKGISDNLDDVFDKYLDITKSPNGDFIMAGDGDTVYDDKELYKQYLQKVLNSCDYTGDNLVLIVSLFIKINIIIISKDKQYYIVADTRPSTDFTHTVLVYYENNHFETIKTEDNKTVFTNNFI